MFVQRCKTGHVSLSTVVGRMLRFFSFDANDSHTIMILFAKHCQCVCKLLGIYFYKLKRACSYRNSFYDFNLLWEVLLDGHIIACWKIINIFSYNQMIICLLLNGHGCTTFGIKCSHCWKCRMFARSDKCIDLEEIVKQNTYKLYNVHWAAQLAPKLESTLGQT